MDRDVFDRRLARLEDLLSQPRPVAAVKKATFVKTFYAPGAPTGSKVILRREPVALA